MSFPDLITTARATQNAALAALYANDPAYLASLITAAGDLIRRVAKRDFTLSSYCEYHSGGIYVREPLRLRQFPVTEITRVAASPRPALLVLNLDSATNQRATVETTPNALRLVRVASAVVSTIDLSYATYPTLGALAAHINAVGGGWSASALGGFTHWASADLKPRQGAATALEAPVSLEAYVESLAPCSILSDGDWGDAVFGWRLDDETGELFGRFPRGQLNLRIDYQAGFAVVPQAVQEACVQLVQDLYQGGLVNNSLKKATLGPSSLELKDSAQATQFSGKVRLLLAAYVDHSQMMVR